MSHITGNKSVDFFFPGIGIWGMMLLLFDGNTSVAFRIICACGFGHIN